MEDLLPGQFDTAEVEDIDILAHYQVNPQKKFSEHASEIALAARASYRVMDRELRLSPVGAETYTISENDPTFSPSGLRVACPTTSVNDVTVIGLDEPQAYVRDYFVGDGFSSRFYLSQQPFQQNRRALINEKYQALDATTWKVSDTAAAISVGAQALQINGGNGVDGESTISFVEQIELGGALELQHGDISFTAPSRGVIGGLYAGQVSTAGCLAGFQITPSGSASSIQALLNGSATGAMITTTAGHRYLLTTYVYSMEVYRSRETYHSSGNAYGGSAVAGNVRVVLQAQDINPSVPSSMLAPATVLYDGVISNAPGFCAYALLNAVNMQCSIAGTYVRHISTAEVRSALPDQAYETQLVESLSDGGECAIVGSGTLDFYPQYVPPLDTLVVVSYRGVGAGVAAVVNEADRVRLENGADDGVRSAIRRIKAPRARTQADCENAALAILADAAGPAWVGTYETWSDFLPGGAGDIFPGDGMRVTVPSREAIFEATVRNVNIAWLNPENDRGVYTIAFANDLAQPLAIEMEASGGTVPLQDLPMKLATTQVGSCYLTDLTNAQITQVSPTTVEVDAGLAVPNGCGIEVRLHDFGWGPANDRNLLGRFGGRAFSLPRFARTQNYFLRLYDGSSQPRYSRYAAALHVDHPYA